MASNSGISDQILARDEATGDTTLLQRYEPGASTPEGTITHDYWEEAFIVTGTLTDLGLGVTFDAGSYACRPPGMQHGPFTSATGCLTFIVNRYS
ncbi:cupin domain-containing protein [Pseudarthrobacter sp. NamE5]|uniref:cupin domain-containing protein n=1 Tax=Pseudarthrobacter sp. NamE5 TaxID=2576839 RepID=UPI00352A3562